MSDIPAMDVDMTAHVILERASFPASTPAGPAAQARTAPVLVQKVGLASGLMLAMRFVQARVISVWGFLVAAVLCQPAVFAEFAVFSAAANVVSIASLMRLEAVFFQNNDRERLGRAFRVALAVGIAFLCTTALLLWAAALSGRLSFAVAGLFLASLICRATIRLLWAEATAEGDFRAIGNGNIVQALVQPGAMLLLIWSTGAEAHSLFLADAIGHGAAAAYMIWRRRAPLAALVQSRLWSLSELVASAIAWRDAPRLLLPSALFSYGFMIAPLMALPHAAEPILAAHVALAMRLLDVPTQMFSTVSVPLVLNTLRTRSGEGRQFWVRLTTFGLLAAAALLFIVVAIVTAVTDGLLDGTQWAGVGSIVTVMTLFYLGIALVAPLHEIASLSRHPLRQLATNAASLLAACLVVKAFGTLSLEMLAVLGLVSLLRMAAHIHFAWTRLGMDAEEPQPPR